MSEAFICIVSQNHLQHAATISFGQFTVSGADGRGGIGQLCHLAQTGTLGQVQTHRRGYFKFGPRIENLLMIKFCFDR